MCAIRRVGTLVAGIRLMVIGLAQGARRKLRRTAVAGALLPFLCAACGSDGHSESDATPGRLESSLTPVVDQELISRFAKTPLRGVWGILNPAPSAGTVDSLDDEDVINDDSPDRHVVQQA